MPIAIKRLNSEAPDFWHSLKNLLAWDAVTDDAVFQTVQDIIQSIRSGGDQALIEFTTKFDQLTVKSVSQLEMPLSRLAEA